MLAFILTSRSMGKVMPKLSAAVKYSRTNPDHCLLILPISWAMSGEKTCGKSEPNVSLMEAQCQSDRSRCQPDRGPVSV